MISLNQVRNCEAFFRQLVYRAGPCRASVSLEGNGTMSTNRQARKRTFGQAILVNSVVFIVAAISLLLVGCQAQTTSDEKPVTQAVGSSDISNETTNESDQEPDSMSDEETKSRNSINYNNGAACH
jgi:cytoskeletal protein RodZ